MTTEPIRYCADCGKQHARPRSLYCADCWYRHACPDCNGTGEVPDERGPGGRLLGPGDLGLGCERCGGEGELPPPLTEGQRAELVAKAEAATAQLAGAGKLEGSQLERFAQLYRGDFEVPRDVLEGGSPSEQAARALVAGGRLNPQQAAGFVGRAIHFATEMIEPEPGVIRPRPPGFPVRGIEVCQHGAGRGTICADCAAACAIVPNRPLLIVRLLELVAELVEQANRDGLPGAPVLDTDFSDDPPKGRTIPATLEILNRVINARDAARAWATDREVCFADFGPCACNKCAPAC